MNSERETIIIDPAQSKIEYVLQVPSLLRYTLLLWSVLAECQSLVPIAIRNSRMRPHSFEFLAEFCLLICMM